MKIFGVVSSISSGDNFIFADFETHRCQLGTKMLEMSDLCYLGKNSDRNFCNCSSPLDLYAQFAHLWDYQGKRMS